MAGFEFNPYVGYAGPQANGATVQSVYVPMRDGVRIAVDLYLPRGLPDGTRVPAILIQTRYWRGTGVRRGFRWLGRRLLTPRPLMFLAAHGYAVLYLDVRGTGASFGTRRHPWDAEEVRDNWDLVEWIVAQPWSDGTVGGYGTSYDGTAAELLTSVKHPAIKAAIPRFNEFDGYTDIAYPGGIYLRDFMEAWSAANRELDANVVDKGEFGLLSPLITGVKPVDADPGRTLLRQAVRDHADNIAIADVCANLVFRDDVDEATGIQVSDFAVYAFRDAIESSGAALYGWGGWFDAATADAVIRRFMTFSNRQLAVIGPWNHGAGYNSSPYGPGPEDTTEHLIEYLHFFDHTLKGQETGVGEERVLYYYTLGEEAWKQTPTWPPSGSRLVRWYLGADHALTQAAPEDEAAVDSYGVDLTATTGTTNRWHTQMTRCPVVYGDRAEADRRLLVYTGSPLEVDTEITGHPVVTLYVTSTATDGAFFVYLEEVDPEGRVTYLTEGQLRALHRRISDEHPPYAVFGPYHSFKRGDGELLVPGETATLSFALLPISVRVPRGHRLRVAIAGADRDTFGQVPAGEAPTITVARNRVFASHIDLPVMD